MRAVPTAYEGSSPYVFASYCHDDAERVIPLVEGLADAGLNVWYDQGIHAGDEWPEVIAEHLLAGTAFVAFLSDASQNSHNCRREFNLAMQENKPFVAVLLESFPASPALQMQLAGVEVVRCDDYESLEDVQRAVVAAVGAKMGTPAAPAAVEPDTANDTVEPAATAKGRDSVVQTDTVGHGETGVSVGPEPGTRRMIQKRMRAVAIGVVAAIVAVCIALFATGGPIPGGGGTDDGSGAYTLSTAKSALGADAVEVQLAPREGMSIGDFSSSLEQLKERLDVLVGTDAYDLTVREGKATVVMPASAFAGIDEREVLRNYLARSMQLTLAGRNSTGHSESIALARRNIEAAEVVSWPDESVIAGGYPSETEPASSVVKVTLSEAFADSHRDQMETWGSSLTLVQDEGYAECCSWRVVRDVDGRSLYVCPSSEMPSTGLDTLAFCYTHDALVDSFKTTVNHTNRVTWEDPGSSKHPGENQVAISALQGEVAHFRYSSSGVSLTAGDVLDWKTSMKMRLDTLGIPYAIGDYTCQKHNGNTMTNVVFAIKKQAIESCVPKMMCSWSWQSLYADKWQMVSDFATDGASVFTIEASAEGPLQAVLRPEEVSILDDRETLAAYFDSLTPREEVTYSSGETVLLRGTYIGKEDGAYILRDLKTPGGVSLDDEAGAWLAKLFAVQGESEKLLPVHPTYEGCWITDSGKLVHDQDDGMLPDAFVERVRSAAEDVDSGARVWVDGKTVWVGLGLEVGDGFPEKSLNAAWTIFDAIGSDFAGYSSVFIQLIDENGAVDELARVGKSLNVSEESGGVKQSYQVSVANGRVRPYIGDFKRILATDAHWKRLDIDTLYEN